MNDFIALIEERTVCSYKIVIHTVKMCKHNQFMTGHAGVKHKIQCTPIVNQLHKASKKGLKSSLQVRYYISFCKRFVIHRFQVQFRSITAQLTLTSQPGSEPRPKRTITLSKTTLTTFQASKNRDLSEH